MRILFTGVGRRVELLREFREAAVRLKKDVRIFGLDSDKTAPALVFCDRARIALPMKDPGYLDELLSVCMEDKIDLVIPTIDTDLEILSRSRERFNAVGTKVLVSSTETVQICLDKKKTGKLFSECGFRTPDTVSDPGEYKGGYPAFLKPRNGSGSVNAFKVENENELAACAKHVEDYIIQPFVSGREYTIDVFCDWDGNPLSVIPRERLRIREGEVLKTRIELDPAMIDGAKKICRVLKPCGPITIQLIREAPGIDWFIEINPRFGGGVPLSMKAGSGSAEAVLNMVDGEGTVFRNAVSDGAVYSRFDESICVSDTPEEIKGVIFDLDDTLYPEKEYIRSGFKAVSEFLHGDYEEKLWDFFEAGKPAIDELLRELGRSDEKDRALAVYRSHRPDVRPYPGVDVMIQTLRSWGIKVGIITDGRPDGQHNKIEALGLEVDDLIVTDELGGTQFRKPCDIAFRIIKNRWGIPAPNIVYFGDNPEKDFRAPLQLGMKAVRFMNPDGLYQNEEKTGLHLLQTSEMSVRMFKKTDGRVELSL